VLATSPARADSARSTYQIDPSRSTVTIEVGKSGVFSFAAGHTHQIEGPISSGTIDVDPGDRSNARVRLTILATGLKVSPAHEPPDDVPKVQERMDGDEVLAIERYRELTFESTSVVRRGGEASAADLIVRGRLTIRGVTQPVEAPVHVDVSARAVKATGRFSVKQRAFGIKPVSIAGVVAVKDALDISFVIVAVPRT
jgi:polyisoprenoid-binding protein YceI